MQRNIITSADARRSAERRRPGDLSASPPKQPTADDYFDRLIKYVPAEVIGGYLVVEGLLLQLLDGAGRSLGLLVLAIAGVLASWFFAQRVLKVVRVRQLLMAAIAFVVWVAATGGWFATLAVWAPAWGTVSVVVFAILVRIVDVGPLPEDPDNRAVAMPA